MEFIPARQGTGAAAHWASRAGALGLRLVRASIDEVGFQPRQVLGRTVSNALPRFGFNRTRTAFLRALGVRIGRRSLILGPLDITGPADLTQLSIGDDTCITGPLYVDLGAPVSIGNEVQVGHYVTLLTLDHQIGYSGHRCGKLMAGPIVIGHGAWLGSRVTVLPGVSIGEGAVVATGAVVVNNVPANALVGGVPARLLRELDPEPMPSGTRRHLTPLTTPHRG